MALSAVKGFRRLLLKASMALALALADLSFLYSARGEVTSSSAENSGVSLLSTSLGWMKAISDLHLSLPLCVDASALGSTGLFLGGKNDRVHVMGNDMGVCLVHQRSWL